MRWSQEREVEISVDEERLETPDPGPTISTCPGPFEMLTLAGNFDQTDYLF